MTSKEVLDDLERVVNAIGNISNLPSDIALIAQVDGKLTRIKFEDLDKYVLTKDGTITKQQDNGTINI